MQVMQVIKTNIFTSREKWNEANLSEARGKVHECEDDGVGLDELVTGWDGERMFLGFDRIFSYFELHKSCGYEGEWVDDGEMLCVMCNSLLVMRSGENVHRVQLHSSLSQSAILQSVAETN